MFSWCDLITTLKEESSKSNVDIIPLLLKTTISFCVGLISQSNMFCWVLTSEINLEKSDFHILIIPFEDVDTQNIFSGESFKDVILSSWI